MRKHEHQGIVIVGIIALFALVLSFLMLLDPSNSDVKKGHWECTDYGPDYFILNCTIPAGVWIESDNWIEAYDKDREISWNILSEERFNKTLSQCKDTEPKTYQKKRDCLKSAWVKDE